MNMSIRTIDVFPGVTYKVESVSTSQPVTRRSEVTTNSGGVLGW